MNVVREIRRSAHLSQRDLAERSGVAQPNIAAYETGRRRPSQQMIERLRGAAARRPHEVLAERRTDLLAVAEKYGMRDVRVFGSVGRGADTPDSDVDLLVTPPPDAGLMAVAAFALEVEDLLGVRVDVVTEGGLRLDHPIRREAVPV